MVKQWDAHKKHAAEVSGSVGRAQGQVMCSSTAAKDRTTPTAARGTAAPAPAVVAVCTQQHLCTAIEGKEAALLS